MISRVPPRWVLPLIALWLAFSAGLHPLLQPDEGRYVGVALDMLRSGDWTTPRLDGLPFFHKPPLYYWLSAGAMQVFGVNVWAARLPAFLSAAFAAWGLYLFLRRRVGSEAARWSLLVLLSGPLYFGAAQYANLDTLVAACITGTVLLLAESALRRRDGEEHGHVLIAAYGVAALGVLAKGLIGVVLPSLVMLLWLLPAGRWRGVLGLWSWRGAGLFLVLAAPWFVLMQLHFPDFLHYFFVVQHFKRFAETGFNNVQPLWFYPAVIVLVTLPWWPTARALYTRAYWRALRRDRAPDSTVRGLMFAWLAVIVVFFSLPQSKIVGYVLPALPPLSFLLADAARAVRPRARQASLVVSLILCAGLLFAVRMRPGPTTGELASVMVKERTARGAGHEPVYQIGSYHYDFAFYAGLPAPVVVVEDWDDPNVVRGDNWRKELADAAVFAPHEAARILLEPEDLSSALCSSPVSWVVASADEKAHWPVLAAQPPLSTWQGVGLWKIDLTVEPTVKALGCRGTPSAG